MDYLSFFTILGLFLLLYGTMLGIMFIMSSQSWKDRHFFLTMWTTYSEALDAMKNLFNEAARQQKVFFRKLHEDGPPIPDDDP